MVTSILSGFEIIIFRKLCDGGLQYPGEFDNDSCNYVVIWRNMVIVELIAVASVITALSIAELTISKPHHDWSLNLPSYIDLLSGKTIDFAHDLLFLANTFGLPNMRKWMGN